MSESKTELFWEQNKRSCYMHALGVLLDALSKNKKSALDVGSGGSPHLDLLPHISKRVSLDVKTPYEAEGIEPVIADFLLWNAPQKYNIVLCLQTLNRVKRPDLMAKKLLNAGDTLIMSVPYQWDDAQAEKHAHKNVDEAMVQAWFGRTPSFSMVCTEITGPTPRLLQVYEKNGDVWANLSARSALRAARTAQQDTKSEA